MSCFVYRVIRFIHCSELFKTFYSKLKTKIKFEQSILARFVPAADFCLLSLLCTFLTNATLLVSPHLQRDQRNHTDIRNDIFSLFKQTYQACLSSKLTFLSLLAFRFETTVHRCTVPVEYTTTHNPYNLWQTYTKNQATRTTTKKGHHATSKTKS